MSTGCPRSVPRSGVLSRLSLQNYSADTSSPVIGRYRSVTPDLTCNCEYSQLLSSPPSPLVRFSPYRCVLMILRPLSALPGVLNF